jgi:hypothetical protein
MPTFGAIAIELQQSAVGRPGPDFDRVRKKYVAQLAVYTGRPVIIYYANWLSGVRADTSIQLIDMQGLMEVLHGIPGPSLDIVLHSPGGSAEATDSIVKYLRTKFDDIRVFVPLAAMSAATMWALAADRIVMGKHSQLGPIDPQLIMPNAQGVAMPMPARAIVDQFERAKTELAANQKFLAAWMPLMQQYAPGLLQLCQSSEELAKRLVREWLERFMFRADLARVAKAQTISEFFGDYTIHQSHSLGIDRDAARNIGGVGNGAIIDDLEADQNLQDAVLSVHHATLHTMIGSGALKIIENSAGHGFYTVAQQIQLQMPFPIQIQPPQPQPAQPLQPQPAQPPQQQPAQPPQPVQP